ncbi:cytochrome f (chloroplast) [Galdieria partita]|uniref:Cytochrome f n=1 Tax=Galdieria partita TaxID=83374 RepID=A0A9C7BGY5_9RHOD|nr:cytochrome f [Galdieria partita]
MMYIIPNIKFNNYIKKIIISLIKLSAIVIILLKFSNSIVNAYPIYAQQAYENPREATGRIVCANCHLAQKPIELNIPKSVLPNSVFEAVVKIPYSDNAQQILANANKGPLNVGAILILPEGFSLAPISRLSEEQKARAKITPIQVYNNQHKNILVAGPLPGDKYKEISFPILSPDPQSNKQTYFLKYPIYAGGNRGRGQLYPNGEKSNNALYTSPVDGKILQINKEENNSTKIVIETNSNNTVTEKLPSGIELIVKEGQIVKTDQVLNKDLNVGGFGQIESEFVLQDPGRIKGMILFFFSITLTQILLILKKKQFEKVQAKQLNI